MSSGDPAFDPALLRTSLVPEHQLLRQIAAGAYGQVWLARNRLGAYRAVKIVQRISFDHDRPFEREFEGIKAFEPISRSHEGLVDLLQVGRDDQAGHFYYVMELADPIQDSSKPNDVKDSPPACEQFPNFDSYVPHTLGSDLKRRGRLPLEECIRIGLSLAQALEHLHGQGLVHRDVKPSNIIFVGGVPKLADIGLVTSVGAARSFVGTEGFIPPEGPGSPQADVYSLGIVLYVMSTGKSHQAFPEPLTDLATQPDHARRLEFNMILFKACQAGPRERYQTAKQLQEDLKLLQRGGSVKAKRAAQRRWAIAKKLCLAAAASCVLLVPALLLWNQAKHGHKPMREVVSLYQMGRWHYNQLTPASHVKALEFLTQAVKKDPKFTEPYAELTALYTWNMLPGITNEQIRLEKVRELADQALAIDRNSAEGHTALSWCRFLEKDWRGAEAEIQLAIKLKPDLGLAHDIYCFYLSMQGRVAEAHREGQLSANLPPASQRASAIIASWPYVAERRLDRAIAQLQRVLELDRDYPYGYSYQGDWYEAASNYVAAIEAYKTADLLRGEDSARVEACYGALRQAYDTGGEQAYLRKCIEFVHANRHLPANEQMLGGGSEWYSAGYHARLGEIDEALKILEERFEEPQVWHQLKFLPMFDPLHDEPRFKALLKRAGLEP